MRGLVETVRSRFLYRTLDAAMTASLRPRRAVAEELRSLVAVPGSNYDRIGALVRLCDRVIPGTARRATSTICGPLTLPFEYDRCELLAYGSGSTVFVLESRSGRRVVKVYRRTLGRGVARLEEQLVWYRRKYERFCVWFEDAPGLMLPSEFRIVEGPLFGRPAVACLQPFVEGEKLDFFEDFTDAELVEMMDRFAGFGHAFRVFANRTVDLYRTQRMSPDMLGRHNLLVAVRDDMPHLLLTDYGVFDLRDGRRRTVSLDARIEPCVRRLEGLLERLGSRPSGDQGRTRCEDLLQG